ncbi:NitT/TauT family transport system substrate-binding protein [termite gut metagenome]|uniref:NitT/TauT family transport system substrate-binding protein n=1 Tax=termite gut metagenome TaxID=433724 RepID=A0A5J4S5R1_9ZZZZ
MKFFSVLCSAVIILSACTNPTSSKKNSELPSIRLGAMSSMDYLPFVVAKKQGIYESLGLEVDIVKFFSANDRDAAFQAGNVDGTVIDYTGAALQQAGGIGLGIVMKNDGYFCFIAGKESGIERIEQLKNTNIAVSRNTVIEYATDYLLAQAGIALDEVNKPEINKIPIRLEMLQNGQIDASVLPDPFASIAVNNGHILVVTTRELGISVTGTIFSTKALKEKNEEIKLLVKGYNQAVEYIHKHPRADWIHILIEDVGVPESLAEKITLPSFTFATLPPSEDIKRTVDWLAAKKLVPDTYTGDTLVVAGYQTAN